MRIAISMFVLKQKDFIFIPPENCAAFQQSHEQGPIVCNGQKLSKKMAQVTEPKGVKELLHDTP